MSLLSLAVVVIVIVLLTMKFTPTQSNAGDCKTPSPTATVLVVDHGLDGLSAYDLWIAEGNTGSKHDFLDALVGVPGPAGYSGSNGISGADGRAGRAGATGPVGAPGAQGDSGPSAYQLWLDSGNSGTSDEFLASLVGTDGVDGLDGLSAFDLWKSIGNDGEIADFIASLKGEAGEPGLDGLNGANGLSAYEIWLANGNEGKSVDDFLASLKGAPGTCTPGDAGKSAYELWLAAGNEGTVSEFLASLKGDKGDAGAGLPFNASFFDTTSQANTSSPNLMRYNTVDSWNNGIRVNSANKSRIIFDHVGVYNIQFSTQFAKTDSGTDFIDIWLRKNGVDVPMTNTELRSWGNDDRQVAAWNFFVDVTTPGDYYEIAWQSADKNISMLSTSSNGKPGIPSVILTVTQVY